MTTPTLSKTWQFAVNQTLLALGTTNANSARLIRSIKNILKGFGSHPWTCSGSSNAAGTTGAPTGTGAMDGVDRWTTDADVNGAGANSRHPWMVLRQTGIATNFEICFDLNSTGSINTMTFVVSPAAGFTGGSATARPTATDEIVTITATTWINSDDTTRQLHVWQSSDGQCTRVMVWCNATTPVMMPLFWIFDKPKNPVSGWTNPSIFGTYAITAGLAITNANLTSSTSILKGLGPSGAMVLRLTGEGAGSTVQIWTASTNGAGNQANELDGTWPFYPIGIYSLTVAMKGRHGELFDLWWKSFAITDGDNIPTDLTQRKFVCFGPFILPWTGDGTVPLMV